MDVQNRESTFEAPVPKGYEDARVALFFGRILLAADDKPAILWNPEKQEWEVLP